MKNKQKTKESVLFPAGTIIEIIGNVASGKTTTSRLIPRISSMRYVDVDIYEKNPFLPHLLKNPDRWSFTTELHFAYERSKQLGKIIKMKEFESLVLDSGFDSGFYVYSRNGFVQKFMNEHEWHLLSKIYEQFMHNAPPITATIFLEVPVKALMDRIWTRGRKHEEDYSRSYVKQLQERINEYKQEMIALKKRKHIVTYHQLEDRIEFHGKEHPKIKALLEQLKDHQPT